MRLSLEQLIEDVDADIYPQRHRWIFFAQLEKLVANFDDARQFARMGRESDEGVEQFPSDSALANTRRRCTGRMGEQGRKGK